MTLSTVKVKVVPLEGFFTLSDSKLTSPLASVIPESLSVVVSLQWPDTVAPSTGLGSILSSTIVTVAIAV
ncbi:hypothetical protein ES703_66305 [subsurface metagenome]